MPKENIPRKHIVVSVHGIRTYGQWQERLGLSLRASDSEIEYHAYTYGYFSILAFLIPPLRWLVVRQFREALLRICHRNADARVDLVGHSFGTHIIAWGLLHTPQYLRPQVNTVILSGSVLRPSFPWQSLLDSGDVRRVINDCGIDDKVLWLNQLTVLFTGMAGRVGLAGLTSDQMMNRYFKGGHSLYFVDSSGQQSNAFMLRYWAPLLLFEMAPERVDERGIPTAWDGFLQTIIQNSEPIKLTLYAALLVVPVLTYRQLYLNAKAEHETVLKQDARNKTLYVLEQKEHDAAIKQRDANLCTLQWALNQTLQLPTAQTPEPGVNPAVIPLLSGIIGRLIESGYDGKIKIEGNTGIFCMDDTGRHLAQPKSTVCNVQREFGIGFGERNAQSMRRLLMLNGMAESQVTTVSFGSERPEYEYPKRFTTAGAHNAIALRNAHLQVVFLDSGTSTEGDRPECSKHDVLPTDQAAEDNSSDAKP